MPQARFAVHHQRGAMNSKSSLGVRAFYYSLDVCVCVCVFLINQIVGLGSWLIWSAWPEQLMAGIVANSRVWD